MNERISYRSTETESIEKNPRILLSQDLPERWSVSILWRDDKSDIGIDAEYKIKENLTRKMAFIEGQTYGKILNLPVLKYNKASMLVISRPAGPPTPDQIKDLQIIMQHADAQKFRVH
jgi:hypothetical protein